MNVTFTRDDFEAEDVARLGHCDKLDESEKRTQWLGVCMYPFSKEPTAFSDGSLSAENHRHTFAVIPVNCVMGQLLKESCFSLKDLQADMKVKMLLSSRVVI